MKLAFLTFVALFSLSLAFAAPSGEVRVAAANPLIHSTLESALAASGPHVLSNEEIYSAFAVGMAGKGGTVPLGYDEFQSIMQGASASGRGEFADGERLVLTDYRTGAVYEFSSPNLNVYYTGGQAAKQAAGILPPLCTTPARNSA